MLSVMYMLNFQMFPSAQGPGWLNELGSWII